MKIFKLILVSVFFSALLISCSKDPIDNYLDRLETVVEKLEGMDFSKMDAAAQLEYKTDMEKEKKEMDALEAEIRTKNLKETPEQQERGMKLKQRIQAASMKALMQQMQMQNK